MEKHITTGNNHRTRCTMKSMLKKLSTLTTEIYVREHGVRTSTDFSRKGSFSLEEFIQFMLTLRKSTVATSLRRFSVKSKKPLLLITSQAFSQLRCKIKSTYFYRVMLLLSSHFYGHQYKTLCGYRLIAIDGSKIALPNTKGLRIHYGTTGAGNGATTGQASFALDLLNNVIVDAGLHRLQDDERSQALGHLAVIALQPQLKSLVLYDRGYASLKLFTTHTKTNIACLFRMKSKFNSVMDELPLGDHLITIGVKTPIIVRILKFELENGTIEMLATTLFDVALTLDFFKKLYSMRWGVETFIDVLKNKLELYNFSGRTIDALEQDFYTTLIQSLLLYVWVNDVNSNIRQKKDALYQRKVNIKHAIGVLSDSFINLFLTQNTSPIITKMTELIVRVTIPIMPNRHNERWDFSRDTKYPQNSKSVV